MKFLKFLMFLLLFVPINVWGSTNAVVDITNMSIRDLNEALEKGYLTSELLVKLYLERIEEYDGEFNSIRSINEEAINEAKKYDAERKNGHIRSSLHGIPLLVKNNIDVLGMVTTAGTKSLSDNYPKEDAAVIKKLKEAGAIILATTNMSEMAFKASDSKSSYGNVFNAFNPLYSSYGSSGGSAVGLSLSFGAASLGTDTNASVRVPASAAGLVGLRPTFGIISTDGVIPYDIYRDTVGILTKTVADNKIILEEIGYSKKEVKDNLKIGVVKSYLEGNANKSGVNGKTDKDISSLGNKVIELLKDGGEGVLEIGELLNNYYLNIATSTMSGLTFCDSFNKYIKNTAGTIRSFKDLVYDKGHIYSIKGYLNQCGKKLSNKVYQKKEIFKEYIDKILEDYDVLIYPTVKNKIFKLGENELVAPGAYLGSVIGYPSITVPMGYIEGFPYGLEILGVSGSEDVIYEVASKIESLLKLDIVNSPLTPSLYEIPEVVEDLKNVYELYYEDVNYQELTLEARNYFLEYHNYKEEEREKLAYILIDKYNYQEDKNDKIFIYVFGAIDALVVFYGICKIARSGKRKTICR